MTDINVVAADNQQITNAPKLPPAPEQKTVADWFRDMRFNADVNKHTVGVDSDHVTPELLLNTSKKLLGISKGEQEPDPKDSLAFQRFYGPAEYFAQHIQRDGGKVARSLLWKATNKGNLDFMQANSLQPHISSVFYDSNLSQYIDGSTPFEAVDDTFKTTRVGQGGIASPDNAPDEMRTVQPSYFGYVDPVRCYAKGTLIYSKQGWIAVQQVTGQTELACYIDGHMQYSKPTAVNKYLYNGIMYGYDSQDISYLVTPTHDMYIKPRYNKVRHDRHHSQQNKAFRSVYSKIHAQQIHNSNVEIQTRFVNAIPVDQTKTVFVLPPLDGPDSTKLIQGIDIIDFAAFMGWYIAQGSVKHSTKTGNYTVIIAQSPTKNTANYNEIRDLIMRMPFSACPQTAQLNKGHSLVISGKQLYKYCQQFGDSRHKYIPSWIFSAPTEARWAFVHAILKGAGSKARHLNTVSQRLAKDFQRLLIQLGQSVYVYKRKQHNYPDHPGSFQIYWHANNNKRHILATKKSKKGLGYYTKQYSDYVYCPTVPGGLVYIKGRITDSFAMICGNSGLLGMVGLNGYLTKNVLKGTDGKLYQKFINAHTGKQELVDSVTAANSIVASSDVMDAKTRSVFALGGKTGVRIVDRDKVDYYLPRPDEAYSTGSNLVTMLDSIKEMRLLMGCLHPLTPMIYIDAQGCTHIEEARNVGKKQTCLVSCSEVGKDDILRMSTSIARMTVDQPCFYKIVLNSGRTLLTSYTHKWAVIDQGKLYYIEANKLLAGMKVPRSLFHHIPVRPASILGQAVTEDIAILLGRLQRSLQSGKRSVRFTLLREQQAAIKSVLQQFQVKHVRVREHNGELCINIQDCEFLHWVLDNVGKDKATRRVPACILSAPVHILAAFLDSYSKELDNVGMDGDGDVWLLNIDNELVRQALAFMLARIYTDTLFRDFQVNGKQMLALKLVAAKATFGDCTVDTVKSIIKIKAPGMMIDFDVQDKVYACGNGIITHNSKYATQAIPLVEREVPLVQSLDRATGKSMEELLGKKLGTRWAPKPGVVTAVRGTRVDLAYDDGSKGSIDLYKNFPANIKGFLENRVLVKAGDKVGKGQLIAASNFTDDNGVAAMGRNLRIGYMSYGGNTYQDATVISESAAKKMASKVMYKTAVDLDKTIRTNKDVYSMWKPSQFTKEQLEAVDTQGLIKPGTVVHKGDPLLLAVQTTEPSPGTLGKRILTDKSQIWEHDHPGVVTDVVKTRSGVKIYATVQAPVQIGDKLTGRFGNKATCAAILPDDQMPKDSKGNTLDMLMSPLGIVSRCYDKDTQFLTKQGWKFGQQIGDTDILYSYDPHTDTCHWSKQLAPFYKSHYTGIMYGAKSNALDFLVTVGHKVYGKLAQQPAKQHRVQDIYGKNILLPFMHTAVSSIVDHIQVTGYNWYTQQYSGMTYCPTVDTGYVLTRRNGKIICLGNTNPAQLLQTQLGKIAQKLGHPVVVPQFTDGEDRIAYVKKLSKQYNVPWKEDVYDPESGRTLKGIFTGKQYVYKLKHMAESKMSARGTSTYTAQQIPASGGQQGCFPATQNILTIHGQRSIARICQKKQNEYVLTWNKQSSQWQYGKVVDWFIRRAKIQDILSIQVAQSLSVCGNKNTKHTCSLYPTKNHNMYLYHGQTIQASKLHVGDLLAGVGPVPTQHQKQALLGTMMGNSCRTPDGGIQCCHSLKQRQYLEFKRDLFSGLYAVIGAQTHTKHTQMLASGKLAVIQGDAATVTIPHSWFTRDIIKSTTRDNKRHINAELLNKMGDIGLCLWLLDDGCCTNRQKKAGKGPLLQVNIATNSFTLSEVIQAATWLQKRFGVAQGQAHITVYTGIFGTQQPVIVCRRLLSQRIAQLICACVPYYAIPKSKAWLRRHAKERQEITPVRVWNVDNKLGIIPIQVLSIQPYKHDKPGVSQIPVYDITVEHTHNYTLSGGVKVSNSKRFGGLESIAMIGHNAFDTLVTDAKLIRGQQNADFWRQLRTGEIPTIPGQPLVHKKFFAHLTGAGVNVRKTNKGISVFALTNKDVNELTGPREVKTRDTYESKNFRPMDGGLFGQDVFGMNGDKWGYIKLDQPMLNPVMEQPIARLLRLTDKDLTAIMQGDKDYNGATGPDAINKALEGVDIHKERIEALKELKAASLSTKDKALKRYVAIARMDNAGVQPKEFLLNKIPVIPPKFRPITSSSGMTMVADSNYLYAQLIDARNDLKEAKDLPPEYQQKARQSIYKRWKELAGLYDPEDVKLKSKSVKGLLDWALGISGSPKYSAFQRKVFGSIVDTVGRGVVVPDVRVRLNQLGIPEPMAWNIFSPFVSRALVNSGYTPVDALKQIKQRTPLAREYLLKTMDKRPVLMNRAPSLHKLSIMGFKPRLVAGHAIHVNPSVVVPFGMDFDGNCCDFDSEIILKISKSSLAILDPKVYSIVTNNERLTMLDKQITMDVAQDATEVIRMKIGDFPKLGEPIKDRNGADVYTVPVDIQVMGCDPVTGKQGFYSVYGFTEEHDCATADVTIGGRNIIVSTNESLAVFDPIAGSLTKVRPEDTHSRLIPVLRKSPVPFGTYGERDIGWFLGAMLSDGWISKNIVGYCKQEEAKRNEFVRIARAYHENFTLHTYTQDGDDASGKLGDSVKLHISSATFAQWLREFNLVADSTLDTGRAALKKQLQQRFIDNGSEEFLFGILSGLIDGDGSIVKNTVKAKPRFTFRFATSNKLLSVSVCNLAYRLGIRYSITTVPPRNNSGEAYIVRLSVVDMYKHIDKLTCVGARERNLIAELKAAPPAADKLDQIPLSEEEVIYLKSLSRARGDASLYTSLTGSRKAVPSCARYMLDNYLADIKDSLPNLYQRVVNTETLWCKVDSVTDAGKRSVYDIMVEGAKVYAINNGVIIWDTVNIHAPVAAKAVQQVKRNMLPEDNLIALKDSKILYRPEKQFIQGIYIASRKNDKAVKRFPSLQDARKAYHNGTLDVDDPIEITGRQL